MILLEVNSSLLIDIPHQIYENILLKLIYFFNIKTISMARTSIRIATRERNVHKLLRQRVQSRARAKNIPRKTHKIYLKKFYILEKLHSLSKTLNALVYFDSGQKLRRAFSKISKAVKQVQFKAEDGRNLSCVQSSFL